MSVQKYLQMREKWLKKFVKFLNPDADEIRGAYMSNDWTSTSRSQFFWASFFLEFLNLFLDWFWIFSILKRNIFKDLHALHTFRLVLLKIEEPLDVVLICPWSAHDQPVIYRPPPAKCAKNCVLVNFFRFSKSREKSQKTQRKSGFLCHFLLIKTAFFLKRSSQKCIIKTIISYTTNAQLFHWKTFQWNVFKNVF